MLETKNSLLLNTLSSTQYKKRLETAYRFEKISGGGLLKKIKHLLVAPGIYIRYILYAKMGLSRLFQTTITLFWGRKIKLPLQDYDALILYMYGALHGSEMKLTKFLIKNLKQEDVFYDIGANRGFYTFLSSELCKEVHTFEPMQELATSIKNNVRNGEVIIVNPVVLSDKNGAVDFYIMKSTMLNTLSASVAGNNAIKKVAVPSITIDKYVTLNTKPTFIKIDAEGSEEIILKGGLNFLSSNSPTIAMEIWGKDNEWQLSMRAAEELKKMGYRSFRIDEEGNETETGGDLSATVASTGADNFIFRK